MYCSIMSIQHCNNLQNFDVDDATVSNATVSDAAVAEVAVTNRLSPDEFFIFKGKVAVNQ